VLLLLAAMKLERPNAVFLLRGNHESRIATHQFTFHAECLRKWSAAAYEAATEFFDALPLAAVVGGRFFCVHGGISPSITAASDVNLIHRFREVPTEGPMCDLVWADPCDDYDDVPEVPDSVDSPSSGGAAAGAAAAPSRGKRGGGDEPHDDANDGSVEFGLNESRGCSITFNYAAVRKFFSDNPGIISVIRAHEVQDDGYKLHRAARVGPDPAACERRRVARQQRRAQRQQQREAHASLNSSGVAAGSRSPGRLSVSLHGAKPPSPRASGTPSNASIGAAASARLYARSSSYGRTKTSPHAATVIAPKAAVALAAPAPPPFPVTMFPTVISVFSAPNYCGCCDNTGAFITLTDVVCANDMLSPFAHSSDAAVQQHSASRNAAAMALPIPRLDITRFFSTPHPYELPAAMNGFDWSFPFMTDKLRDVLDSILAMTGDDDEDDEAEAEAAAAAGGLSVTQQEATDPAEDSVVSLDASGTAVLSPVHEPTRRGSTNDSPFTVGANRRDTESPLDASFSATLVSRTSALQHAAGSDAAATTTGEVPLTTSAPHAFARDAAVDVSAMRRTPESPSAADAPRVRRRRGSV
jgi:diadenosine tetraphosphatase ApaH/serine/threonine PP2A family protein phosphatase